jgi:hypothetical protein
MGRHHDECRQFTPAWSTAAAPGPARSVTGALVGNRARVRLLVGATLLCARSSTWRTSIRVELAGVVTAWITFSKDLDDSAAPRQPPSGRRVRICRESPSCAFVRPPAGRRWYFLRGLAA